MDDARHHCSVPANVLKALEEQKAINKRLHSQNEQTEKRLQNLEAELRNIVNRLNVCEASA